MTSRSRTLRRQEVKSRALLAWAALTGLILLWQVVHYRGLIAFVGEWQFNAFGRYYPTLTYVLLVALLVSPGLLLFGKPRSPRSAEGHVGATIASSRYFTRVLFGATAVVGACCLAALGSIAFLPGDAPPLQNIVVGDPALSPPHEGLTRLSGAIVYNRTAAFDEDLVLVRHNMRFAPMVAPGGDTHDLRYFVELPPVGDAASRRATVSMTGILKEGALPGEVVRLFRYAGHRVEPPYYVLFARPSSLRWPHLQVAGQLALGTLALLLLTLWQRRRTKKIVAESHEKVVNAPSTASENRI